ncbi:hypothetical protein O9992_24505 [Vibrio lentus]|nr:hypothetical protein [Vibrio lentus]
MSDQIFYLDKIPGERNSTAISSGDRLPMSATGIGKALMIDMPKMEWIRLISYRKLIMTSSRC